MEIVVAIDRIEGPLAILEVEDRLVEWPLSALPRGVQEGSTLRLVFEEIPTDLSAQMERIERLKGAHGDETEEIDL